MARKQRTVAVIGLGAFGTVIARELTRMGDDVIGIDCDEVRVTDLADEIHSTLQLNATDIKALMQCDLSSCDCIVVAIGDNMQANILACMNVMKIQKCPVWAKADNEAHEDILRAVGVQNIVRPEHDYGLRIAQVLHNPSVEDYLSLGGRNYLIKVSVPKTTVGKRLDDLDLKHYGVSCLGIFREGHPVEANLSEHVMVEGDTLLIHGSRPDLRRFADEI